MDGCYGLSNRIGWQGSIAPALAKSRHGYSTAASLTIEAAGDVPDEVLALSEVSCPSSSSSCRPALPAIVPRR
jgi:hypothetical protein